MLYLLFIADAMPLPLIFMMPPPSFPFLFFFFMLIDYFHYLFHYFR